VLLECGDRAGAEVLWTEVRELANRSHDATLAVHAESGPVAAAYLDGRLEEALALAEATSDRAREIGVGAGSFRGMAIQARFALGRGSAGDLEFVSGRSRPTAAQRALVLAELGRHEEAHVVRERFGDIGADEDESAITVLLFLFAAAIKGDDAPTMQALSRRLAPYGDQLHARSWLWSIGRFLGDAAALLDDPRGALSHYERALDVCAKVRFRPEIATIRLHQAGLLLQHFPNEHAKAQDSLDFAIAEFRAMNMQPALERALRHKGLLHA
jgi:hypothetical protein